MMLEGVCHCGAVRWRLARAPETATACSCTVCRRYGTRWGYGDEGENAWVAGATAVYVRGDRELGFHFCAVCGGMAYWRALNPNGEGVRCVGVNLRMVEDPASIADLPVEHFDGLNWIEGPRDGRTVADMWF
jgi:hypothetical protein